MDPQEYTSSDRNYELLASGMPDLSEVSAAVLALIKAVRKLEKSSVVASVTNAENFADLLITELVENVMFDEHEDLPFVGYDMFSDLLTAEKSSWMAAIKRDEADTALTQPTIDLAAMVQGILGGKS
ncbi:MAG: hypothetical protein ACOVN5_13140 [Aquidulcibacter sp.]|jgi:hypothetical protein